MPTVFSHLGSSDSTALIAWSSSSVNLGPPRTRLWMTSRTCLFLISWLPPTSSRARRTIAGGESVAGGEAALVAAGLGRSARWTGTGAPVSALRCITPPGAAAPGSDKSGSAPLAILQPLDPALLSNGSSGWETLSPLPLSVPGTGPRACWRTWSTSSYITSSPTPFPPSTMWEPVVQARAPSSSADRWATGPLCTRTWPNSMP